MQNPKEQSKYVADNAEQPTASSSVVAMEWSSNGATDAASDGGDFGDQLPDDTSDAGLQLLTATACPDIVNQWLVLGGTFSMFPLNLYQISTR